MSDSSGSFRPVNLKSVNLTSVNLKSGLISVAALFLLIGCSLGSIPGSNGKVSSSADERVELARRPIATSSGSDGYDLTLVERGNTSEIELAFNSDSAAAPQLSKLEDPPRLVLDLPGALGPKTETINTPESLYVDRVRIGSHPGKSRIVLDLSSEGSISSDLVAGLPGQYTLKIAKAGNAEKLSDQGSKTANDSSAEFASTAALSNEQAVAVAEKNTVQSPSQEEQKTEVALNQESIVFSQPEEDFKSPETLKPTADLKASPDLKSDKLNEQPLKTVSKVSSPEDSQVVAAAKVSSYQLQAVGTSENTLIIEGENLTNYSLKRSAPSEFVLRLPDTRIDREDQATVVAPNGSGAIRSVRSKLDGNMLELRIFTAPDQVLQADSSSKGIVVSAVSPDVDLSVAKAQAAKEVLAGSDTPKKDSVDDEIAALLGDSPKYSGRLISLDLQDTDIDNALRIIAEVSNLNIIASEEVTGKITLRLIDVPWDQALDVILKTNGLDMIQENNVVRIAPVEKLRQERESLKQARQAEEDLEPLAVRYVRISYAKAAELKPLVESVLSERGAVAYDERTNQLIIKDIRKGIANVAELIAKLDLRTPQVLLETQIVEATTTLARELGSEFGFNYIQSPGTGNATGYNFPNSVAIGGSGPNGNLSSFPVSDNSAISLLLESADGTRSLSTRLTALESEGRVKVVSKPAVATTNNKQATIKSVETIRIKNPDGGLSVATGQGASAAGNSTATEEVEIGIILEVTPQASPDYFVLLDINAKSSTLGSTVVDGIPSEIERSATSSVLVSSGQTFAMGGIYKTSDSNTVEGVPFFKDIPVFGNFFRRSYIKSDDEELLFFITPRIIEGSFDDAAMKAN